MRRVTRFIVLAAALTLTAADTGAEVPIDDARRLVADREFQSAIDLLENYAEQHEDDARAWLELGRVYLAAGHWDDAIRTQEKAAEMRPNDVEFRLALSAAYREKARRSGGFTAMRTARKWKKELERCYEMWPDNIEVRRWLVGYLLNAPGIGGGDKDRGLEIAEATAAIDDFEGRMLTAYAYRMRKDYNTSIARYESLLEQYPDSMQVHGGIGYTYFAQGDLQEAIDQFLRWTQLAPENVEALTALGDSYHAAGEFAPALVAFREALEIDPFWSEARYPVAQILDEQKDYSAAREEYEFVAQETPEFRLSGKAKKRAYQLKKKKY